MTDHITLAENRNAISSPAPKRSLSPDEGEIIEDAKRSKRESLSPAPNRGRQHNNDGRQFKVVYEGGGRTGQGYGVHRDRGGYGGGRRYEEPQRYGSRGERYDSRSPQHERRDWGAHNNSAHYQPHKRSRSRYSSGGYSPRSRSRSSEGPRGTSIPRSPSVSPRGTKSGAGSSLPRTGKESSIIEPSSKYYNFANGLTCRAQEPETAAEPEPLDEEALIEARRRKREAILAKYQGQGTPSLVDNFKLQSATASAAASPVPDSPAVRLGSSFSDNGADNSDSPLPGSRDGTPDFEIDDANAFEFTASERTKSADQGDGPSAADYDPTNDMKIDNERRHQHEHVPQLSSVNYDETKETDQVVIVPQESPPIPVSSSPQPADEDEDDMFATPPSKTRTKKDTIENKAIPAIEARQLDASMLDRWHDPEGYYIVILGELLNKRYVVQASLGQGMFSGVVRCLDNEQNGKPVAIKILRNNEAMRKAGLKEIGILQKLMDADPEGRKHVIRLEGWFEHKGHLCLVFENLSLNLREVLKKFGRDVGINLKAVRAYAQQLFVGLSLLRKCNLLHADLKPDNILVTENRTTLKICDLGSASHISENDITPYLVSRFYRAPEIILGLPYDYAIDVWSAGCTLFELYTGKILFDGRSNNQMLRLMLECRGRFPPKMLRKGHLIGQHFNDHFVFMSQEIDSVTGNPVVKPMNLTKPVRELKQRVLGSGAVVEGEGALLASFIDFLGRCLELNPEKRITPSEAFRHPFIKI